MRIRLIATTTFGLEAVAKREIADLGYEIEKVEDGKITYIADERGIVRSNLWLRTPDRILLKTDEFKALEFEELFQRVKGYPWEELIPLDGEFTVTGVYVRSKLSSVPACQSVVKKAIVERLKDTYEVDRFEETGAKYTVKVSILKDIATITVDTTGQGLHKRGYRIAPVEAPIKETMAAALVLLSFWKEDRILVDPFCGSGTISIEAAMIGLNIAPGLNRKFVSQEWHIIDERLWKEEKRLAYEKINSEKRLEIYGFDISGKAIEAAIENAIEAGVAHIIRFKQLAVKDFKRLGDNGVIVTNPPYGKRIGKDRDIIGIYKDINKFITENTDWSLFLITADENAEYEIAGRKVDRRRKLFNGRIKTCYYQFHGKRLRKM